MKIVVIGGSGRVGSNVVRRLVAQGHDAVPASPATGVDTITGEGLADVMAGADVVVDVSNAPVWEDDAVREFFTTSTRNLLAAERDAGVGHHLAVTIVGADRLPDSGYLRAKVAQEAEIEAGDVPYTILRCTQFFEFLPQIVEAGAEDDSVRLPTGLMQLVAADDVAATVAELATGSPANGRVELGGPEALGVDAWARRLFAATGDERQVIADPQALYFGTELTGGELTTGDGARIGAIDFDTWFAARPQESPDERDQRDRHRPRGGLQQRSGVLVREPADGGDRPARGAPAPPHRPTGRRLALAGGHHEPGARPGRGLRAARGPTDMRIVVVGGSGLIGDKVMTALDQAGHQAVAASPAFGIDAYTGEGARRGDGGSRCRRRRLQRSGVGRREGPEVLHDRDQQRVEGRSPRRRAAPCRTLGPRLRPAARERLHARQGRTGGADPERGVPFTIVHSTQFMQFLARVADAATERDVVHAPDTRVQPIAAVEVARFVAAAATAPPARGVVEIAGPEALAFTDAIGRVLATRGDRRRVVADPDARYFGAVVRGDPLLPGPEARIATLRLADWLAGPREKAAA